MEPGAGERLEPGADPTWRLWTDSKQIGNCRPTKPPARPNKESGNRTKGLGFLIKWGTVARTASNSQHGTSDFRQMGNWLESQLGREHDTKRAELRTERNLPRPPDNSEKDSELGRGFTGTPPRVSSCPWMSEVHFGPCCCHQITWKTKFTWVNFKGLIGFIEGFMNLATSHLTSRGEH